MIPHHPADGGNQFNDILGLCLAQVDDKIGVFGRNLCVPYAHPFAAGRLNQPTREIPFGVLKNASTIRYPQRLNRLSFR